MNERKPVESKIRQACDGMLISAFMCFGCLVQQNVTRMGMRYDQTGDYHCAFCGADKLLINVMPQNHRDG